MTEPAVSDFVIFEWNRRLQDGRTADGPTCIRDRVGWSSLGVAPGREAHMLNWRDYITVDPQVCHGRACITGTRVLVTTVLDNLAAGLNTEEIIRSYPSVTAESVQATMCYAADLANERVLSLSG